MKSKTFGIKCMQMGKVSHVALVNKLSMAKAIILSAVILHEVITWKIAIGASLDLGQRLY